MGHTHSSYLWYCHLCNWCFPKDNVLVLIQLLCGHHLWEQAKIIWSNTGMAPYEYCVLKDWRAFQDFRDLSRSFPSTKYVVQGISSSQVGSLSLIPIRFRGIPHSFSVLPLWLTQLHKFCYKLFSFNKSILNIPPLHNSNMLKRL